MTRTILRGGRGGTEIIGYLEDKQDEILLRDSHNVIAGRYRKLMGWAYDKSGKIIGDNPHVLMTLLCDD